MSSAFAFAVTEAIRDGALDYYLDNLQRACRERKALFNQNRVPPKTPEMLASGHQVWVWMNGPGRGHWEVRGTGLKREEPRP